MTHMRQVAQVIWKDRIQRILAERAEKSKALSSSSSSLHTQKQVFSSSPNINEINNCHSNSKEDEQNRRIADKKRQLEKEYAKKSKEIEIERTRSIEKAKREQATVSSKNKKNFQNSSPKKSMGIVAAIIVIIIVILLMLKM